MFKPKTHLAIFSSDLLPKVLANQKKIDIRLSQNAIAPYLRISKHDKILIKKSGGKVYGEVLVDNVLFHDKLTPKKVDELKSKYNRQIQADEQFWKLKSKSRYASIIFLKEVKRYLSPIKYTKHDRRPWVVLNRS